MVVRVSGDKEVIYRELVRPQFDPDDQLFHYRGFHEPTHEHPYHLTWDWHEIRMGEDGRLILEAHNSIDNTLDDSKHAFKFEIIYRADYLDLPAHDSTFLPILNSTMQIETDDNGGLIASTPDENWGTTLFFNNGVEQWGNHYHPFHVGSSGPSNINYGETWHNISDRDPIETAISLRQSYSMTDGETMDIDLLHLIDLVVD
jgi:hypothetical protein